MKQKKVRTNKICVQKKRFAHDVCTNGNVEWNTTRKILANMKKEAYSRKLEICGCWEIC
jgi:hypothetical protein